MAEFNGNFLVDDLNKKCGELMSEFDTLKLEIDRYKQELSTSLEENGQNFIVEFQEKLNKKLDELNDVKNELDKLKKDYQEQYNQAETNTNLILDFEKKSSELNNKIIQYYNEVFTGDDCYKVKLTSLYDDYLVKSNEINKFNNKLFTGETVKTGKVITEEEYNNLSESDKQKYKVENNQYVEYQERVSIKEQIDTVNEEFSENYQNFKEQSAQALEQNQKENEELRDKLKNMIEELVSGATNAGLAKSHEQAKNEHNKEMIFWRVVFIVDMLIVLYVLTSIPPLKDFSFTLSGVTQRLLLGFPIILPLIWLAMLANRNIHQNKRLYEEYLHKWAIAFSFDGMKREINELDPTEEKEYVRKLLDVYLEATKFNPSSTLDKKQQIDSPFDKVTEVVKELTNVVEKLDNQK